MGRVNKNKIIALSVLAIITVFLIPVLLSSKWELITFYIKKDFFIPTLIKSASFAFVISIISVVLSYITASYLFKIRFSDKSAILLTVLFVPFLLGNVSTAFIFKLGFMHSNSEIMKFAYDKPINTFIIVGGIQLWQYCSLFIYLFWLSLQSIKHTLIDYAYQTKLTKWELHQNIIFPHVKSLTVLLLLFAFVFNFYEDVKFDLIFKSSQGLDTELISKWLYRTFRGDMSINVGFASEKIFTLSLFIIIFVLIALLLIVIMANNLKLSSIRINFRTPRFNLKISKSRILVHIFMIFIVCVILFPIIDVYVSNRSISITSSFIKISKSFLLTLVASIFASFIAIIFTILSRIAWKEKLSGFNTYSTVYIGLLLLLLTVPPITLMISGFYWIKYLNLTSNIAIILFWILGHSFITFPILSSFSLINHFRVKEVEIDFHKVHKTSFLKIIKISFIRRFRLEYALTLIFAYSLIWNEAILNRVFSDDIPSFVSSIIDTISSRNADYSIALTYLSVSILIAFLCITLWLLVVNKNENNIIVNENTRN